MMAEADRTARPPRGAILQCDFCAHRCRLAPGGVGRCGVRTNRDGTLVTTVAGQIAAAALDPIEKKPLYHVRPGTSVFSIALAGCSFTCDFCQNASIALERPPRPPIARWSAEELAERWDASGAPSLAFTYTEPGVWQDYLIEAATIARRRGATVVMVTNGFLTPEACRRLIPVVDAFNIDLKGDERFYDELCGGHVAPVRESIAILAAERHVEVTTMLLDPYHPDEVIGSINDHLVNSGVPVWHISRFYPSGRMLDHPATSEGSVGAAIKRVLQRPTHPPFIYAGNTGRDAYQRTLCPNCGSLCIDRSARYSGVTVHARGGTCPACGYRLPGIFAH